MHWDFGDGNTSDDVLAYNSYSEPGVYTVTLTVTNADGVYAVQTYTVDTTEPAEDDGDDGSGDILLYVAIAIVIIAIGGIVVRRFL